MARVKTVGQYLEELKGTRKGKPPEVKEALEVYIDLWEDVIKNGTVSREDEMGKALGKIEAKGDLYRAAQPENAGA